jgi:hypothetical protein
VSQCSPNYTLQAVGGTISVIGCFYGFNGRAMFHQRENEQPPISLFPAFAPIFTGLIIAGIGEGTCERDGSYWAAIGGAFAGEFLGIALRGALHKLTNNDAIGYTGLMIPFVTLPILLYSATLENKNIESELQSDVLIRPMIGDNTIGLHITFYY